MTKDKEIDILEEYTRQLIESDAGDENSDIFDDSDFDLIDNEDDEDDEDEDDADLDYYDMSDDDSLSESFKEQKRITDIIFNGVSNLYNSENISLEQYKNTVEQSLERLEKTGEGIFAPSSPNGKEIILTLSEKCNDENKLQTFFEEELQRVVAECSDKSLNIRFSKDEKDNYFFSKFENEADNN